MPQILVSYDASLDDVLDRRAFARELHAVAAETDDGITVGGCRTRFQRVEETVVGDDQPGQALVHLEFAILPGRTEVAKRALGAAVLDVLRRHTAVVPPGTVVHASVDVTELGTAYTAYKGPGGTGA
ncbi:isomerase [Streptomyces sp. NBC_01525]|uniref:5-carboxymethyl-2-hydroxymuconate Delta-isomerase n=1 Tax=Streptomyces sp. NBC_01525 TaxID=2903893 RepID=UPI00386E5E82